MRLFSMGRENRNAIIIETTAFKAEDSIIAQTVIDTQLTAILEKNDDVRPRTGEVSGVSMPRENAALMHSATMPLVNTTREHWPRAAAQLLCMCRYSQ